jgi:hypothetical protein
MIVSGLQPLTISRLLVSVDWLHRCKLPLQVQDRGFRRPRGSTLAGSFTNTDYGSTAIPHDAADIDDVEADQPFDHQQIRDRTDCEAGPLLDGTGIAGVEVPGFLANIGAEMAELHVSPHGTSSSACHELTGWQMRPLKPQPLRMNRSPQGLGGAARDGVDEHAGHGAATRQMINEPPATCRLEEPPIR